MIDIYFSLEEKERFLVSKGYSIIKVIAYEELSSRSYKDTIINLAFRDLKNIPKNTKNRRKQDLEMSFGIDRTFKLELKLALLRL